MNMMRLLFRLDTLADDFADETAKKQVKFCLEKVREGILSGSSLRKIQEEQKPWVKHNFGDRPSWMPLLGAVEELGELSHSFLKRAQGIRVGEKHGDKIKDAVGDIILYLMDFCTAEGIDMQSMVEETWATVRRRDWKADPVFGLKRD